MKAVDLNRIKYQKYITKEGIVIIPITKREMEFLKSKGFKFHDKIFKTYSGNNKYSACEEYRLIQCVVKPLALAMGI